MGVYEMGGLLWLGYSQGACIFKARALAGAREKYARFFHAIMPGPGYGRNQQLSHDVS